MQRKKDNSETGNNPAQTSNRHVDGNDDEDDDDPSRRRVVMIHDENGNTVPRVMGKFVYDSVHSKADTDIMELGRRVTHKAKTPQRTTITTEDARKQLAARIRTGMPNQGRGVDLSSSSEEDITSSHPSNRKNSAKDMNKAHFVDDDSTLDQEEVSDKFANQFMRIEIEASKLKDVSTVTKDLDHDRQDKGTGPRIMVGLQRMMSNTKDAERLRPVAIGGRAMQKSVSGLQRTSSFAGGIHRTHSGYEARPGDMTSEEGSRKSQHDNAKGERQGITAIGRVLSINRNKTVHNSTTSTSQNASTHHKPGLSSTSKSNPSLGYNSHLAKGGVVAERGLEIPEDPHSQQSTTSGGPDRPRASDRSVGASVIHKRAGIGQVGRLLSRNRAKSSTNINVSLQHKNDVAMTSGAEVAKDSSLDRIPAVMRPRASLSKIGRMISLKRSKPETPEAGTETSGLINGSKKTSPMSSSTISSTSMGDLSSTDRRRDRDRGREGAHKTALDPRRESRLNLRNAGRMFSLTRRSGVISVSGDSGLQRKTTLTGGMENAVRETGKSKKDTVSAPGTSKADKFVNSEVTSEAIAQSGVLGGSTHIRVAVIAMAEFSEPLSRDKWFVDVFTLPHNAVRRECMDLYDILSALARCDKNDDLCKDDIDKLESWWKVANQFLRCYFEVERRVLFPWVDSAGAQEWEVQLALKKMRSLKDKLETLLTKMERVWNEKTFKTNAEMYGLLYKAADEFVPRLVNYFMDQEVLLPAIVKEFYSRDQRVPIDKQMVDVFMNEYRQDNSDETRHNLVLLVRWMNKSRQLRAWLGKNLPASARAMYPSWYQMYEDQHASVLQALRSRATTTVMTEQP